MFIRLIRYLAVAILALSGLLGTFGSVVAQNTTKVTELTQRTIVFDQSWSETSSESDSETGLEFVMLDHVDGGRVGFIFSSVQLDQAQARDAAIDGTRSSAEDYTVIDSGQYDTVAYELAHFDSDGRHLGIFVLVVNSPSGTTVIMVIGEVDTFKDAVGRVQAGVTLDGAPVLDGVDGAGLQTQLQVTGATSITTSSELSEVEANESETASQETGSTTTYTEFTSPSWGYTVSYPGSWQPGEQGIGEFDLIAFDPLTLVGFQGIENVGLGGYEFEAGLKDTFLESLGPGGELLGTYSNQNSAVFVGISDGMILIQEVIAVSPTVAVIVTAVADSTSNPDSAFANLRGISVNGIPLLSPLG